MGDKLDKLDKLLAWVKKVAPVITRSQERLNALEKQVTELQAEVKRLEREKQTDHGAMAVDRLFADAFGGPRE